MLRRKVMFYKVALGINKNGQIIILSDKDKIIDVVKASLNFIEKLPFKLSSSNSRYFRLGSGDDLSLTIDSFCNNTIEGRIILCRRTILPAIELHGDLSDLELAEEAGLAEVTHFKYYVNYGILGIEYNFHGPKASGLIEYFNNKLAGIIDDFILTPITDKRYCEILSNNKLELVMLSIKAAPSALSIIEQFNTDLGTAFKAAYQLTNSEEVEITIKRRRRSKDTLRMEDFSWRKLFEKYFIHREEFQKLSIDVIDNSMEETERKVKNINLLEDKLCLFKSVEVLNDNPKRILSTSVYHAIDEAFNECKSQLILS